MAGPCDYRTYSRFARDPHVFLYVVNVVLFALAREAVRLDAMVVRVWSVGCAGGEEPYSLAIAWVCALASEFPRLELAIWATDIDDDSLERARAAVFDYHAVRHLPVEWIARCFEIKERAYVLRDEVKQRVAFSRGDARCDPPPNGPFSLVSCRYSVFLYASPADSNTVARRLVEPAVLRPGGYLVTGLTDQVRCDAEDLGLRHHCDAPAGVYLKTNRPLDNDDKTATLADLLASRRAHFALHEPPAEVHSFVSKRSRKILRDYRREDDQPRPRPQLDGSRPSRFPRVAVVPRTTIIKRERPAPERRSVVAIKRQLPAPGRLDDIPPPRRSPHRVRRLQPPPVVVEPPELPELEEACRETPIRTLSVEETERLVERLMADVVRRQQSLSKLQLEHTSATSSKLSRRGLAKFLGRVAADIKRRKASLLELQMNLAPIEDNEQLHQERRGLDGLRSIASQVTMPQLAVQPTRLVRYLLRTSISAKVLPDDHDSSADHHLSRTSPACFPLPSPRALATRAPVPDQTSTLKCTLKLGTASLDLLPTAHCNSGS